jgi:predicted ABC-type ATPase
MVAGPNGSGKTTLTRLLRQKGVEFGEYINPDDIARELEGSYDDRVRQAQTIADRRREACIEAKRSFSFETVMSHPSKVNILVRAKIAGFFVQLSLSAQTILRRISSASRSGPPKVVTTCRATGSCPDGTGRWRCLVTR